MTTSILRIDASTRDGESYSRRAADILIEQLSSQVKTKVLSRDLSKDAPALLDGQTIAGFFTPDAALTPELRSATATSDQILQEIADADALVISTPMFNFSIPASLKAWIDQVVRLNRSFSYDGSSFNGLIKNKTAYVIVAYGAAGYANNGPYAAGDFAGPYLKFILNFIGIVDVRLIQIEGTNAGPDAAKAAAIKAEADIRAAIKATPSMLAA
jgi:FMN-dependent NADH-azoreductase